MHQSRNRIGWFQRGRLALLLPMVAGLGWGGSPAAHGAEVTVVAPGGYESTEGPNAQGSLLWPTARTYQVQIEADHLVDLVGLQLTGISWRLSSTGNNPSTSPWPTTSVSWGNYDITLAQATNEITEVSNTFADNMTNPVQVRSGPLTIDANLFPVDTDEPNSWGPTITFDTPYAYGGGDLVIEYRHTGRRGSVDVWLDAVESNTDAGYWARGRDSYEATTSDTTHHFPIHRFHAIPEPGTLSLLGVAGALTLLRRRRVDG